MRKGKKTGAAGPTNAEDANMIKSCLILDFKFNDARENQMYVPIFHKIASSNTVIILMLLKVD